MDFKGLEKIISEGESVSLEFKKSTAQLRPAGETLCAFLNGKGGQILIGIAPSGEIKGQDISDKTLLDISSIVAKLEPSAPIDIERIKVQNGKEVIILTAHPIKSYQPFSFMGRSYHRIESSTQAMPRSAYQRLLKQNSSDISWEKEAARGFSISDLDENEVLKTRRLGISSGRLPENTPDQIEDLLSRFGLIENGVLLNAAIVLFGKKFLPHFPQCQLRLAKFKGSNKTEFVDQKQMQGNAFSLLEEAMLFLRRHLPIAGKIIPGILERKDEPLFPLEALREALVNALCHRCYEQPGSAISVAIFDDRLEIWSDGMLPFDLKIEDLKKEHASHPRNPLITNVFFRRGLIEQWGRGTQRIVELCIEAGHQEPEFLEQAGSVVVRFIPAGYVPPHRIEHDLSERQRHILHALSQKAFLSLGEVKKTFQDPPKDRAIRGDFQHLKKLGLIGTEGKGRAAKWFLVRKISES